MDKKVLLVNGASSDIGVNLIKNINNQFDFIIAHHNGDEGELKDLKIELGEKLILLEGNFLDEEATYQYIDEVKKTGLIPTHIVHFPAGKYENIKFAKLTWDKFKTDFDISFRSLVLTLNAFLPQMAKNKFGKIVVMLSSCTINVPPKYVSSYVSSKYALLGLVKALANEYADKSICINGISPTMVETKYLKDIPDLIVEQNAFNSPTGKNLQISDVIPKIEFLLSENSDCITGQNLAITNGNII